VEDERIIKKLTRILTATLLAFGFNLFIPENANATCINHIQSQTIAAAYEGDAEPTVHHMDTCSGDDIGYQTYWAYPNTPSISLYSMDWFPGVSGTSGLDIYYSEGGFQLNLNMVPFGNYGAQPSTVNILVAITNTGNLAVSYSYQGPEYPNLRTGVRLHNGDIVSLEAWGATQVSASEPVPVLQAEPIPEPSPTPTQEPSPEPSPTPTEAPITPEEQQEQVAEAVQLAGEISDLNNLIAAINGEEINEPETEPTTEPEPEPSPDSTEDPDLPEPDVEVDPEIITPEDPRFPDDEQTEPEDPTPSPSPDTTDGGSEETDPTPEPSEEPTSQPEETDQGQEPEPEQPVEEEPIVPAPDNNDTDDSNPISADELNKLNKLIGQNDAKLAAELSNMLTELSTTEEEAVAESLGIKAEEIAIIAEAIKDNPAIAVAFVEFAGRAEENAGAPMPYTLADAITEVQTEAFLADPLGVLTNIDFEKLLSPTEWGKDMTDDQREKVQEVVIPVILVGNIVSSVMSLRRL